MKETRIMERLRYSACAAAAILSLAVPAQAEVKVLIERNTGPAASGSFAFPHVPPPSKSDAASAARAVLVQGLLAPTGGGLGALNDGRTPRFEDEPGMNFYFGKGALGGCFRLDLGRALALAQVNSFSWHPKERGPQVYKLYASASEVSPKMASNPRGPADPAAAGWMFIASVDARAHQTSLGGQYGVSITDTRGSLGSFRHLLFCCETTIIDDADTNTFFSEVDVVEKK